MDLGVPVVAASRLVLPGGSFVCGSLVGFSCLLQGEVGEAFPNYFYDRLVVEALQIHISKVNVGLQDKCLPVKCIGLAEDAWNGSSAWTWLVLGLTCQDVHRLVGK